MFGAAYDCIGILEGSLVPFGRRISAVNLPILKKKKRRQVLTYCINCEEEKN